MLEVSRMPPCLEGSELVVNKTCATNTPLFKTRVGWTKYCIDATTSSVNGCVCFRETKFGYGVEEPSNMDEILVMSGIRGHR
jgi:hypothetical protein